MLTWIAAFVTAAIVLPLLLWAVNRRRPGERPRSAAKAGPIMMAIMALCLLLFGVPGVLMVLGKLPGKDTDELWVQAIFLGFALLALFSLADGFVRRLAWSPDGLEARNWKGSRARAWSDVASIDYKPGTQAWRVGFRDGTGLALSEFMSGARDFLEEARSRGIPVNSPSAPWEH